MPYGALLSRILHLISPSTEEEAEEQAFSKRFICQLKKYSPRGARVLLMGSVAKGTFLRDSKDMDVFILLPKSVQRSDFERIAKTSVQHAFPNAKKELRYAEHPYVRVYTGGRRIDVVPAYNIKDIKERMSAVDRSIFHTKFVLGNLRKKQVPHVLLLKKFLKANELYGAEIRVQGFSGYLCELLVIKYKNFMNAMRLIARWKIKSPVFIDIKKYYKNEGEIDNAIKKFKAPLVVIDPVDRDRNVAAAVSKENLKKLIALAKKFLRNPYEKFFLKQPLSFEQKINEMKEKTKRDGVVFIINIPTPDVVDDILWGQLRRLSGLLTTFLEKNDFKVHEVLLDVREIPFLGQLRSNRRSLDSDKRISCVALRLEKGELPEKKLLKGPELKREKNCEEFRKSHKGGKIIAKKKRLYAVVERKLTNAGGAIREFLRRAILPSHFECSKKSAIVRPYKN